MQTYTHGKSASRVPKQIADLHHIAYPCGSTWQMRTLYPSTSRTHADLHLMRANPTHGEPIANFTMEARKSIGNSRLRLQHSGGDFASRVGSFGISVCVSSSSAKRIFCVVGPLFFFLTSGCVSVRSAPTFHAHFNLSTNVSMALLKCSIEGGPRSKMCVRFHHVRSTIKGHGASLSQLDVLEEYQVCPLCKPIGDTDQNRTAMQSATK